MTRYVGTGDGSWAGDWFRYVPSPGDRALARDIGAATAERVGRRRRRTGYGDAYEAAPRWYVTGFLGEVAGLYPFGSGPELAAWRGNSWFGRADAGDLEVRTTSSRQLYRFATRPDRYDAGLAGWRIVAKDRGRIVVCVEDRGADLVVMGWVRADDVPRLPAQLGAILAVADYGDLLPFAELVP